MVITTRRITVCGALMLATGAACAAEAPPSRQEIPASCVEAEVNGQRALPLDCYQQLMAPSASAARQPPSLAPPDIGARQPNNLGLFSPSALRNRMGNTLGKSAYPQRP
ncbi:hypothetical protein VSX61_09810 [Brenneria populi subsp. brevivirga]|uniref:hypothetical protein n=1 Tax=Brenneria populi TaxID=1505588 RepID=UPI002E19F1D8|nr:hypothetical protein [Brenneria populi subsp. brevivirga]